MKFANALAALLVAGAAAQAQTSQGPVSAPMQETKPGQDAASSLTDGVVQRIDSGRGEVVLKHGDLPNLGMPAMTMAFTAEKKVLEQLKAGDKVRFHAEIKNGKPTVTHIEHVR